VQTYPVILGTAGHIDHGKTSLVKALTGIDTDRLKEEKERGITIELGFAHLDVGGQRFGLVDVPGHERFIKAMVAGAGGVDVVMLVVAADEGVMPQTREHLDICQLLGIKRGVVALTKRDLVDESWLELVVADLKKTLEGTFLEAAAIVPVSSTTGAGLDELRAELVRLAREVPPRPADGPFRLPLDRVFTMKGFGTVVTGTILGGRVRVGDDVRALPDGPSGKVRGLQVHGEAVPEARAGMRCAANLGGVERSEVARGHMLALEQGGLEPTHLLDATMRYTAKTSLGQRSRALVHHGTAQVLGTIILVDRSELAQGDEALVQLHLDEPVAALPGDRFIARGFTQQEHYGTTIGGGDVVRVHAPKVRRSSTEAAATLRRLASAEPVERVALEVKAAGPAGTTRDALHGRLGLSPRELDDALNRLVQSREVWREGDLWVHAEPLARLEAAALDALDAFHADKPHAEGLGREELRSRLPRSVAPRLFDALLAALAGRGAVVADRDLVRRARHKVAGAALDAAGAVVGKLRAYGLETPAPKELPAALGLADAQLRPALDVLFRDGRVVRVKSDYFVEKSTLDALRDKLRAHLAAHGQITPQEWKTITGTSRKYSIPLAEHFDQEKLTIRVGEVRKLRS
jgi:selenocysteine-specific elongation factor